MQNVSRNIWRALQKAFRTSDPLRSGCLDTMTFAYHLLEYDVPLTRSELNYISMTMGDPAGTMPQSKATIRPPSASLSARLRASSSEPTLLGTARTGPRLADFSELADGLVRPVTAQSRARRHGNRTHRGIIRYPEFLRYFVIRSGSSSQRSQESRTILSSRRFLRSIAKPPRPSRGKVRTNAGLKPLSKTFA